MAEKIKLNKESGFGGAVVIVPPGEGETISFLLLDEKQNAAMFWSMVKTKAEIALSEIEQAERQQGAFGARR